MAHFLISAAHKSSGKTTLSIGLCAALAETGLAVQPFKKGPDYIDPMWLTRASGRPCHNLDFYTMQQDEISNTISRYSKTADITVIEGNKGLYDGLDLDGSNSNAALASLTNSPVVLVLDARGMTRGIAPLILGYQAFDPNINIAGVILNQLGGSRHEQKLHAVIEHYTDVKVIGSVYKNPALSIEERHLGLMPSNEDDSADKKIQQIRDIVKQQVDLHLLQDIAKTAPEFPPATQTMDEVIQISSPLKIGVVKNDAFGFYYPGDLDAIESTGAEIVIVDTIRDEKLPEVDALFIGGGFPETRISELEANQALRAEIKTALQQGLPCYAECGGLMYLTRSINWHGKIYPMVGAIPADSEMCKKPQGRGYVRLKETNPLWPVNDEVRAEKEFCAHEFHYSRLINIDNDIKFAYKVLRGTGITGFNDGIIHKNVLASYTHLRDVSHNHWAKRFVDFVKNKSINISNKLQSDISLN